MNNMRNKILSLLVLLLTAATGAWAADPKVYTEPVAISSLHVGDILATGFSLTPASNLDVIYFDANRSKQDDSPMGSQWAVSLSYIKSYGENAAMTFTTPSDPPSDLTATPVDANGNDGNAWEVTLVGNTQGTYTIRLSGTYYDPPIEVKEVNPVTVSGATKQWEFDMPASDVLLTPVYSAATIYQKAGETLTEKQAYETLKDAFANVQDGDVIKLDWNVTVTEKLKTPSTGSGAKFTLDFNGYTLRTASDVDLIAIQLDNADDELTLIDSKDGQMGGYIGRFGGIDGSKSIIKSGRYNINDKDAATLNENCTTLNLPFTMAEGMEFVDLIGGAAANDGFNVRVGYNLTLAADPTTGGTVEFANCLDPFAELTADMIASWENDNTNLSAADLPGFVPLKQSEAKNWSNAPSQGSLMVFFEMQGDKFNYATYHDGKCESNNVGSWTRSGLFDYIKNLNYRVFYTIASLPEGVNAKGNGEYNVVPGTQVTLKAVPAVVHHLDHWSDNVTANTGDNIATITITEATTVTATFADDPVLTLAVIDENLGGVKLDGIEEVELSSALDNGSTVQVNWHGTGYVSDLSATFTNDNGTFTKTAEGDKDNVEVVSLVQDDNNSLILTAKMPNVDGNVVITINTSAKTYSITKASNWDDIDFTLTSVVVNGAVFTPDGSDLVGGIIMPAGMAAYTDANNNNAVVDNKYYVTPGSAVTVKATAAENYHVVSWTNGLAESADGYEEYENGDTYVIANSNFFIQNPEMFPGTSTLTFNMGTANMTTQANFDLNGYLVTVPAKEYITYYSDKPLKLLDNETVAKLYTITGVSGTTATAAELEVASALTPLLIYNSGNEAKDVLLQITAAPTTTTNYYGGFTGTLEATTIAASGDASTNYALNGKQFVIVRSALDITANKAWLSISASSARAINIVFDDATRIDGVIRTIDLNGDYYDLNGRKLQGIPTRKGVYIQNGQKVVVK